LHKQLTRDLSPIFLFLHTAYDQTLTDHSLAERLHVPRVTFFEFNAFDRHSEPNLSVGNLGILLEYRN